MFLLHPGWWVSLKHKRCELSTCHFKINSSFHTCLSQTHLLVSELLGVCSLCQDKPQAQRQKWAGKRVETGRLSLLSTMSFGGQISKEAIWLKRNIHLKSRLHSSDFIPFLRTWAVLSLCYYEGRQVETCKLKPWGK